MEKVTSNVDDIYLAALEREATEERSAYLEDACAGNPELRRRVERLLKTQQEVGSFLESPAPEVCLTVDHPISERPGTVIGPYKLLQQIGEGGMGVVFMAEQTEPIQRTVALKIIKPGMDTRQVIARFEAERQALAMMDHPNIARVLDAGTTDSGRPYFVMELVKGVPITKYCDEKQLPLRARLELLLPVCQAVQHAHQKGIIHRDIKPTNVLVAEYDDQAVPKVIDFGVAKATAQKLTDRTMFTEFGQVVGTVEYMSPEQAKFNQLDIDTRSDIYSLGVLLYELLTGSTPFGRKRLNEAAFDEALRIIREEEPQKPSTRLSTTDQLPSIAANRHSEPARLSNDVRGELDWIVMRALEKDRNRRYETANGLARDVERYLHDEPVQACPPSTLYRFRKFARRNKVALLATAAAMAALVLLVIGLATSNRLISAERDQKAEALREREQALAAAKTSEAEARVNAQHAEAETKRAEESFLRASIAIREVLTKAAMGSGEWSMLPRPLRKRFSEEAVKFYESFLQEQSPDPDLQYEAGVGYRAIGTLHTTAGELPEAEKSFRLSTAILERLANQYPANQQYRQQWAWSLVNLGRSLHNPQQLEEAKNAFQKGAELYEKLASEKPGATEFHVELATCDIEFARRLTDLGDLKAAESVLNRGIATFKDSSVKHSDAAQYNQQSAAMQYQLGTLLVGTHHLREAKSAYQASAELFKDVCANTPTAPYFFAWIQCYQRLFDLPFEAFPLSEREQAYRDYLKAKSQIPDNLAAGRDLRAQSGHMYRYWGFALSTTDRHREAEATLVVGAKVFDNLTVEEPRVEGYWAFAADTHLQIAQLTMQDGRSDEAERQLTRALALYDQLTTKFPSSVTNEADRADFCNRVAWLLVTSPAPSPRNPDRAVELAKKAVALRPKAQPYWNTLGVAQYRAREWQPAVESLEKSMELQRGGDSSDWFVLAMAHWQLGEKDEAHRLYDKGVKWMEKNAPKNNELYHFQAEAGDLLGVTPAQPSTDKQHAGEQPAPPDKPTPEEPKHTKP